MGWESLSPTVLEIITPFKFILGLSTEPLCQSTSSFCQFFFGYHNISVVDLACLKNPILSYGLTQVCPCPSSLLYVPGPPGDPPRYLEIGFNISGHAMMEKNPTLSVPRHIRTPISSKIILEHTPIPTPFIPSRWETDDWDQQAEGKERAHPQQLPVSLVPCSLSALHVTPGPQPRLPLHHG